MHTLKHQISRVKNTELNEIYKSMSLRALATSFIGIFIPIYLLKLGYTFAEVMIFVLIYPLGAFLLEYFVARLIARFGAKHIIAISYPFFILFFLMLFSLPKYHWNLILVAFINSLSSTLFWQSYHVDFSKAKHKKSSGKEISKITIILILVGSIGPFLGGYVATYFGIRYVFYLVILILIGAILPLFKTGEISKKRPVNLSNLKWSEIWRDIVAYWGFGWEAAAASVVWPLFIYFIVGEYVTIGFVTSIALLIGVVAAYYSGKLSDKKSKEKLIRKGGFFNSIVCLLRVFSQTIYHVLGLNMLASITHSLFYTPFVAEYYTHADEEPRVEYLMAMEMSIDLSRVSVYIILLGLSFMLPIKSVLIVGLIFGAIGSLMMGVME